MTPAQLATLKASIIADPVAGPIRASGDTYSLLAWCNGPSSTSAWRTSVTGGEIYDAHKPVEYIARSAAERQAFDLMVCGDRVHDFTVSAKRKGVSDIFSGATNNTSRTGIFAVAQEMASNAQMVLGGSNVSVGGDANMSETITAYKRNWSEKVTQDDANRLVS
jgi:hypothetical protein